MGTSSKGDMGAFQPPEAQDILGPTIQRPSLHPKDRVIMSCLQCRRQPALRGTSKCRHCGWPQSRGRWCAQVEIHFTASAKEYPPQLCKALVYSSFLSLQRVRTSGFAHISWDSLDAGALTWALALADHSCHFSSTTYLPDFQPNV